MKLLKEIAVQSKVATTKVFKRLDKKQLETVVGGPITSIGTVTVVQEGT